MLVARYQVRLKNQAGTVVAIFDNWRALQWQYKINDGGFYSLTLDANDSRVSLFEVDGQVEVWRSIPGALAWYNVFEAHVEDFYDSTFENGNQQFVSVGTGYTGLLGRRTIAYYSGTAQSTKNGVAETVMKEFVDENIGPGATSPPRLLQSGVLTGLTVEADTAAGSTWQGSRHEQNLLDTLQSIALVGGVDFEVVGTGAATYEFRTYDQQLGEDRTTAGLDPSTGLNAAGNVPVIFAATLDNISKLEYSLKHKTEINAVYVWGTGSGSSRNVRLRTDPVAIGITPIGLREASRSGTSQASNAALDALGDIELEKYQANESLAFTPKLMAQTLFGVDFNVGDRITVRHRGVDYNKRVTAVTATVSASARGETLEFEFADIP